VIEVVLAGREVIFFLKKGGGVRFFTVCERFGVQRVLPQVVVKRVLAVASAMHRAEAAVILRDVGITTPSVVGVDYWL